MKLVFSVICSIISLAVFFNSVGHFTESATKAINQNKVQQVQYGKKPENTKIDLREMASYGGATPGQVEAYANEVRKMENLNKPEQQRKPRIKH